MLNKEAISKNFSLQAKNYDATSQLQQAIARHLLEKTTLDCPHSILDIGCGTGGLTGLLQSKYPTSKIIGIDCAEGMLSVARSKFTNIDFVKADAEQLPFPDLAFDLVTSSTTLQWLTDLGRAFAEANRVLTANGQFVFAMFAGQTLHELRIAYTKALQELHPKQEPLLHPFISMTELLGELEAFQIVSVQKEIITLFVTDLKELLKLIKSWGAQSSNNNHNLGLGNRRLLELTEIYYKQLYSIDSQLPVTWETLYAKVRKK